MRGISLLIKPASSSCNMNCKYCFYIDESNNRSKSCYGMMTEDTLKNVIRKTMAQADDIVSIAFQGGEPTLRGLEFYKKVVCLEHEYSRSGIVVQNSLQTNGYLIDESWCEFLRDNKFLVGLSIDGTKATHDMYRLDKMGNYTFDRVQRTAKMFAEYGVDFNILTVVTKAVVRKIDEIYRYYKSQGWNYLQFIPCLEPIHKERGLVSYAITPVEYGAFLKELFDLWYVDYKVGNYVYIRQFENYLGMFLGIPPEACDQRGQCCVQHVIEADGSVFPCDFYVTDEYYLGNMNSDTWKTIQARRKEIGYIERSLKLCEKCHGCKYYALCRGGCQRNRVLENGTGGYRNYFCQSYIDFFDYTFDRFMHMAKKIRENQYRV